MHVSHHHLKRALRAQPTPSPAPPLTPNANIGDPTPPPHHRTRTPVERRNGSPGKHPTPSKITPHVTYPTPSHVRRHGVTRVQGPPFLENPHRLTHCPQPSPATLARHVTRRGPGRGTSVGEYAASWTSKVVARTCNYSQLAKDC